MSDSQEFETEASSDEHGATVGSDLFDGDKMMYHVPCCLLVGDSEYN